MKSKTIRRTAALLVCILMLTTIVSANIHLDDQTIYNRILRETNLEALQANSAILVETTTGKVLFGKDTDTPRSMASLTKIMAALVVMDHIKAGKISWDDIVPVSEYAFGYGGSQVYLEPGETFTLREMMEAIEIHSANDATVAVAEHVAGTHNAFVHMMNERARELGMTNTQYVESTGLRNQRDGQFSTAADIAILVRELITLHPEILEITSVPVKVFRPGSNQMVMHNRNRLVIYYPGVTGLKTGFTTDAGFSVAATAERGDLSLIAVVMGCPDTNTRFAEAAKLLDYGFLNYVFHRLEEQGMVVNTLKVNRGVETSVDILVGENSVFLLQSRDTGRIQREVELPDTLTAPVMQGAVVGKVSYLLDGELLGSVDLIAAEQVDRAGFFTLLWRWIKSLFGIR